jgi:PAS domain S-box-containing protein
MRAHSLFSAAPLRRLTALVAFANLFVFSVIGVSLESSYQQYCERAAVASRNTNRLVAQSIAGELDMIDMGLKSVVDEIARLHEAAPLDRRTVEAFLTRQQQRLPPIEGLRIANAKGEITYASGGLPQTGISIADRGYFIAVRDEPGLGLAISKPILGRLSGKWELVLARRLSLRDGSFDGVIYAPVAIDYFVHKFTELEVGPRGAVVMRGDASRDFDLLARFPPAGFTGQTKVSQNFRTMISDNPKGGTYEAFAGADNISRTFSYQPIANYPLITLVGLGTDDYLADWRHEVVKLSALGGVFLLLSALAARLILRAWRARTDAFEQFRLLLTSAGAGIFGLDENGVCTFCNPAAIRMLGYGSEADLLGSNLHTKIHHTTIDGTATSDLGCKILQTMVSGAGMRDDTDIFWRADGTSFPVEYWAHPQLRGTSVVGVVVTFADISERRMAEQALQEKTAELARSNADLEQFAYVASHDLREPLRMISSYVTLLDQRYAAQLDNDARQFIHFARDGAKRLDQLILGLLEFSRIGRNRPPMTRVALDSAVTEALSYLGVVIAEANAEVTISPHLPDVVADRGELVRLLQNLIGNALKYRSTDRQPEVRISAERRLGHWQVSIADNGIGIPEEQRERIFGIFQRLHGRDQYEGTGIGLAVCRKIVEHHGGRLWVDGNPDGGSIFAFTLPDRVLPVLATEEVV